MPRAIWFTTALLTAGCVLTGAFTPTGDRRFPPRSPGCTFSVYTLPPEGFVEVGVVELYGGERGGAWSLAQAREVAGPHVCKAGGDGLVVSAETGENGTINRATIIRRLMRPDAGASRD